MLKAARKARMGMGSGYIVFKSFSFFLKVFIVFRGVEKTPTRFFPL